MRFRHQFRVRTSLERVVDFHANSASMAAITPPPIIVQVRHAPSVLAECDEMDFTMWLGPLPIHWLARIEMVSETGFTDRQVSGPFAEWVHRHIFQAVDEYTTDVTDDITFRLKVHPLWGPVGFGMWLGLPVLFAFRAWKSMKEALWHLLCQAVSLREGVHEVNSHRQRELLTGNYVHQYFKVRKQAGRFKTVKFFHHGL